LFSPLRDRTYRHLFAAQVLSLAGSGLTTIALALLAYDLAGSEAGAVLGTALAIKMVAYVAIAPVVGSYAHRLPRRTLLIALDLVRAGVVLAFPLVTQVWQVYLLILLLQAASAAFTPTFQATIPDVLSDEERYTQALSLSRLAYDLENLLSPILAALLLAALNHGWLFAGNALGFLGSALLVASVILPGPQPAPRPRGVLANIGHGSRIYLKTPRLRGLLALNLAVAAAGATVIVNTVVLVRDVMGGTEVGVAWAMAAFGGGSMLAAAMLPRLLGRAAERPVMLGGGVLVALGLMSGPLPSTLAGLLPVWFLLGAGSSFVQTPAGRLLRRSSHEGDRPALFSAQFALSHVCWLFTYPLAGWLGAGAGLDSGFMVLAVLAGLSTLAAALLWPARDPVEIGHVHTPLGHEHLHVHDEHHQHEGWEGPEPHSHSHRHGPLRHRHAFMIDLHHDGWPIR
jgi:MFS family permease